jgi:hypothetical protein
MVDILDAYIKIGTKLFHFTWEKKGKSKIVHRKNEEKGEFECLRSESLVFQSGGTLIVFWPINELNLKYQRQ